MKTKFSSVNMNLTTILTRQEKAWEKHHLLEKINELETKIFVYSDRDSVRTKELEKELHELNVQYLDEMVKEQYEKV